MTLTLEWWHIALIVLAILAAIGITFAWLSLSDGGGNWFGMDERPIGCGCVVVIVLFLAAVVLAIAGWMR